MERGLGLRSLRTEYSYLLRWYLFTCAILLRIKETSKYRCSQRSTELEVVTGNWTPEAPLNRTTPISTGNALRPYSVRMVSYCIPHQLRSRGAVRPLRLPQSFPEEFRSNLGYQPHILEMLLLPYDRVLSAHRPQQVTQLAVQGKQIDQVA